MRLPSAAALAAILLGGCGGGDPTPPGPSASSPLEEAALKVQESLALVELQYVGQDDSLGTAFASALVLSPDGKALIPFVLDSRQVHRVRVRLGGREHPATFLRSDPRVGMSLIRIAAAAGPFHPASAGSREPRRGEWVAVLSAGTEDTDYQALADLSLVRGRVPEEFDRLLLQGRGFAAGTVVADLDGHVVGLVRSGEDDRALLFADVKARVYRLLARTSEDDADPDRQTPWLGVFLEDMNEEYAEAEGLPKESVRIREICQGSPAEKAGLRAQDLIVQVDDRPLRMKGAKALDNLFKLMSPEVGREIRLEVLRDGKRMGFPCRFARTPKAHDLKAEDLGIQVREITDSIYHGSPDLLRREGVLVTEVVPGSPASTSNSFRSALISTGEVLLELDGAPTPTLEAFSAALDAVRRRGGAVVLVKLQSGTSTHFEAINLKKTKEQGETP